MARKCGVSVEDLERRTLLSGIAYSLTTDHSVYQAGQPIEITFTETNTGSQPVTVSLSPTDFTVSEQFPAGYSPGWESNPENDGQPPTSVTLQPGQSVSQTATWDGTVMQTAVQQGTSTSSSYAVNQFGTFTVSNPNAPQRGYGDVSDHRSAPGRLDEQSGNLPVGPASPAHLRRDEHLRPDGHDLDLESNSLPRFSRTVSPCRPQWTRLGTYFETIGPGQTVQHQFTLSQRRYLVGSDILENLTGSFAVQVYDVSAAPGEFTADFQIAAPPAGAIVSSVTTNQPVYQAGETVTMTFTETNRVTKP